MIDIALFNAYVIYKQNTDKPIARRDFIISVVEALTPVDVAPIHVPGPGGDGNHKLEKLPPKSERQCEICKPLNKRSRSSFWCPGCNCGIHRECYHKLQHFFRPNRGGRKRKAPSSGSASD